MTKSDSSSTVSESTSDAERNPFNITKESADPRKDYFNITKELRKLRDVSVDYGESLDSNETLQEDLNNALGPAPDDAEVRTLRAADEWRGYWARKKRDAAVFLEAAARAMGMPTKYIATLELSNVSRVKDGKPVSFSRWGVRVFPLLVARDFENLMETAQEHLRQQSAAGAHFERCRLFLLGKLEIQDVETPMWLRPDMFVEFTNMLHNPEDPAELEGHITTRVPLLLEYLSLRGE